MRTVIALLIMLFVSSVVSAAEVRFVDVADWTAVERSRQNLTVDEPARFLKPLVTSDQAAWSNYLNNLRRHECANYQLVLEVVRASYQKLKKEGWEDPEGNDDRITSQILPEVMKHAKKLGVSSRCLVQVFDSEDPELKSFVLLSPDGDYIFEYKSGVVYSPLAELDRRQDGYGYDAIAIGDFKDGYSTTFFDTMSIVGIAAD